MQRVHGALGVDRTPGGDQGLPGDLAAEDALGAGLRALAHEGRRVQLLEVEDLEQLVDGGLSAERFGHSSAGSVSEPSWCTRRVLVEPGALGGEPATTTT